MSELATHIAGSSVTIRFDAPNLDGKITASYRVQDHHGMLLTDELPIDVYSDDEFVEIVIDDELNRLDGFQRKALRIIHLMMENDDGDVAQQERRYAIIASADLFVPQEALITVAEAELHLLDVPNVNKFLGASQGEKRKAIIEASRRISAMRFNPAVVYERSSSFADFPSFDKGIDLTRLSAGEYMDLPARFLEDIAVAVIYEADDVLGGDPIDLARRSGLVSERVGETSLTYQQGRPAQEIVGARAFRVLGKYTTRSYRIGRG
ncbi:hypothetical protein [Photobacterium ganghwense]|uniref:hypothetical protein n=1 Tax=Photobacterium ganghwense TaxID=320778 RepID=UPI001A8CFD46|nr:hypothetical protein [Photobacterium ganghwense]QSV17179.1 hypothetical protein FH974_19770 [Photobacterium ganghwense]